MANWKKLASGAAGAAGGGEPVYVEDVFSVFTRRGNAAITDCNNGVNLGNNVTSPISSPQNGTGLVYFGGYYYYANGNGYVYRTDDVATTATAVQTGSGVNRLAAGSTYIYSSTSGNFYYSTNGTSWTQTSNKPIGSYNLTADCMAEFGGTWYVVLQHPINGNNGVLSYSSNLGSSWTDNTSAPFYGSSLKFLTVVNGRMYAGTTGGALYYTTNGTSWTTCSGAVAANQVAYVGSNYVAAGNNGQIYYSSNGQSFTGTGTLTNLSGTMAVQTVASDGTTAYAVGYGTGSGSYYYTSTNGSSWTQTSSTTRSTGDGTSGFCVLTSDYFAHKFGSLDLDGVSQGGVIWEKRRSDTGNHWFHDTVRGTLGFPVRGGTNDKTYNNTGFITSFNSNGFTTGTSENSTGDYYAWWSFRKYPNFFDCQTWTGNGTAGRTISHDLGKVPAVIMVKRTDAVGNWHVYHRSLDVDGDGAPETDNILLNSTNVATDDIGYWNDTAPTSTQFTLGSNSGVNANGGTYIAYIFAHHNNDGGFGLDGNQDIIKCDVVSYPTSGDVEVDLGFEPQWVLYRDAYHTGNPWFILDNMRGWEAQKSNGTFSTSTGGKAEALFANTTGAEVEYNYGGLTSTGFKLPSNNNYGDGNTKYIYIAIRRGPMKVPTNAEDVWAADISKENYNNNYQGYSFYSGFPVDSLFYKGSLSSSAGNQWHDRMRTYRLYTDDVTAEDTYSYQSWFHTMEGAFEYGSGTTTDNIAWMWRRAPNFYDVVAYTGNGTARTISHNLGAVPEMMWVKSRTNTRNWMVYHKDADANPESGMLRLDGTFAFATGTTTWNNTQPTASVFSVGTRNETNNASETFIAYLFASLDGVSKVGGYTGDGTTNRTIDCGFSSGARFVMIKSTGTGGWYVFDTERGIVSGNDPWFQLETDTQQQTHVDYIDPTNSGFIIGVTTISKNQFNSSGDDYIFYAIA